MQKCKDYSIPLKRAQLIIGETAFYFGIIFCSVEHFRTNRSEMNYLWTSVFFIVVARYYASPNGASEWDCRMAEHSHAMAQTDTVPYTVSAVNNGKTIQVNVSSLNGKWFQGFVLQARSSSDRNRIVNGKFSSSVHAETIDCGSGRQNTLTHSDEYNKTEVITEWTPDEAINEAVIFRAIVKDTSADFWTRIDSSQVKKTNLERLKKSVKHSMYDNCSVTEGCFGYPANCTVQENCEVLLTRTSRSDGIFFAMYGYLEHNNYMAMGLSIDDKMGDDAVTDCSLQGKGIIASESYNDGKMNTRKKELDKRKYSSEYKDGLSACSFSVPFLIDVNGTEFNLANSTYYILLAKGKVQGKSHLNGYHHEKIIVSQMPINFTEVRENRAENGMDTTVFDGETVEDTTLVYENTAPDIDEVATTIESRNSAVNSSSQPSIAILLFAAMLKLALKLNQRCEIV